MAEVVYLGRVLSQAEVNLEGLSQISDFDNRDVDQSLTSNLLPSAEVENEGFGQTQGFDNRDVDQALTSNLLPSAEVEYEGFGQDSDFDNRDIDQQLTVNLRASAEVEYEGLGPVPQGSVLIPPIEHGQDIGLVRTYGPLDVQVGLNFVPINRDVTFSRGVVGPLPASIDPARFAAWTNAETRIKNPPGTQSLYVSLTQYILAVAAGSNLTRVQSSQPVYADWNGKYLEFKSDTTTVLLQNFRSQIISIDVPNKFIYLADPMPALPTNADLFAILQLTVDGQIFDRIVAGPLNAIAAGTTLDKLVVPETTYNFVGKSIRFRDDTPTDALKGFRSMIAGVIDAAKTIILLTPMPVLPTDLDTLYVEADLYRETPVIEVILG